MKRRRQAILANSSRKAVALALKVVGKEEQHRIAFTMPAELELTRIGLTKLWLSMAI